MYEYVGNGNFHHGIPGRDLSPDDWDRLDEAQRALVREGGLYRYVDRGEQIPGSDPVPGPGVVEQPAGDGHEAIPDWTPAG